MMESLEELLIGSRALERKQGQEEFALSKDSVPPALSKLAGKFDWQIEKIQQELRALRAEGATCNSSSTKGRRKRRAKDASIQIIENEQHLRSAAAVNEFSRELLQVQAESPSSSADYRQAAALYARLKEEVSEAPSGVIDPVYTVVSSRVPVSALENPQPAHKNARLC
jgi:hypothetical protein